MNLGTSKGLLFGIQACNINGVFGVKWERWRQKGNEVTVNTQRSVSIYFKLRGIVWQSCARKDSELSDFQSFTSKIRFILHIFFMELISYCSIWNFGFWSNLILPSLDVKSHELTFLKVETDGESGTTPWVKICRRYVEALSCSFMSRAWIQLHCHRHPNCSAQGKTVATQWLNPSTFRTNSHGMLQFSNLQPSHSGNWKAESACVVSQAMANSAGQTKMSSPRWRLVKLSQPLLHPAPAFA